MSNLIFNPMISLSIMIPYSIIMIVIIILNKKNIINRIIIILLILVISQRPMLKNQEDITFSLDLDVLFVIDNTVSMKADDVNKQTRLEAVKKDCISIMEKYAGANFAVITFGNIAEVRYPFTSDMGIIKDVINRIKVIDPAYATGSVLELPYDFMKMFLESSKSKDNHQRIVFFMGDGEITQEDDKTKLAKYADLQELIDSGAVLGYGTSEGTKIKIEESVALKHVTDSNGYLLDSTTNPPSIAISKINENTLKALATNLDLDYYHMSDFSILSDKLDNIKGEALENEEEKEKINKDIYYYFSGALVVLLLFELYYYRRNEQ